VIDSGKRLFRPGRGLAALAVSAMLIGGVAFAATHGAIATHAQTPAATGTAAAGGPPPLPTLPPKTATPSGPPPLPTVASTPAKTATAAPTAAKTPVSTQAPKPVSQAPAPVAQKPAAVQLPNTGNGGVTGSDSSPLLPAAAGLGAVVLVAGGVYALRSRKHED